MLDYAFKCRDEMLQEQKTHLQQLGSWVHGNVGNPKIMPNVVSEQQYTIAKLHEIDGKLEVQNVLINTLHRIRNHDVKQTI